MTGLESLVVPTVSSVGTLTTQGETRMKMQVYQRHLRPRVATGPRTRSGKSISSRNSLKHGLLSKEVVIQDGPWPENASEYRSLLRSLTNQYKPVGPLEGFQIEIVAAAMWRYRRLIRAEAGEVLDHQALLCRDHEAQHSWEATLEKTDSVREARIVEERRREQRELARRCGAVPQPDDMDKFVKYEAHLLRVCSNALSKLEELQRMRRRNSGPDASVDEE